MLYNIVLFFILISAALSEHCEGLCAYSQGYWKNHNKYSKPSQNRPWPNAAEDLDLCGTTRLDWMSISPVKGDPHTILAHQWIAAYNNLAEGRCTSGQNDAIFELVFAQATVLVEDCVLANANPKTLKDTQAGRQMIQYASLLEQYNAQGLSSPHCPDDTTVPPPPPATTDCGARVNCRFVEICEFENPPNCDNNGGGNGDDTCTGGCTYTIGYWMNPNGNNGKPTLAERDAAAAAITVCGVTGSAILDSAETTKWWQVGRQLTAVRLNIALAGACTFNELTEAIAGAQNILDKYCGDKVIPKPSEDWDALIGFATTLEAFNSGAVGPGHCP